jgi:hypothetical protein
MSTAMCLSSADDEYPDNYFLLNFKNFTGDTGVSVLLSEADGDKMLNSGTYTLSDTYAELTIGIYSVYVDNSEGCRWSFIE